MKRQYKKETQGRIIRSLCHAEMEQVVRSLSWACEAER